MQQGKRPASGTHLSVARRDLQSRGSVSSSQHIGGAGQRLETGQLQCSTISQWKEWQSVDLVGCQVSYQQQPPESRPQGPRVHQRQPEAGKAQQGHAGAACNSSHSCAFQPSAGLHEAPRPLSADTCEVWRPDVKNKCRYVQDKDACGADDSYIHYLELYYCGKIKAPIMALFFVAWLALLFYTMSVVAEVFLCPAVQYISERLSLP
eukprot:CAMPEP_0206146106 /NCGR_PEP_ID=MMETSP1473-20131121/29443_1 /ASSEMBLY_ACC=CAM_ASM_001109 /TAXON_ID=1461547 /ORGANISM="Stichococcus sp, Strain RCC1054" /LENGTH=206 /DNA_ID=CAMNT_0053542555 /DNA_START=112 /DNA_END=729 /DNA_ORIENTATION=+